MTNSEIIQGRLSGALPPPGPPFDATATGPVMIFEVLVGLAFIVALILLPRHQPRLWIHLAVVAVAVLIFELFTAPLWRNLHLGEWAYLYQQTSWILTLGWSSLILGTSVLVDTAWKSRGDLARFALKLAILTPVVFGFEILLGALGVRQYAPEVWASVGGHTVAGVPVEALYYVPVFIALILGFHGYWAFVINGTAVLPRPRPRWARLILFAVISVLLFELMVEPLVQNLGFPGWSFVYRDISLILTLGWVALLVAAICLVEVWLAHWDLSHRFLATLAVIAAVAAPAEAALIAFGHRVYGPSATERFTGLTLPLGGVPLEVVVAVPLYFALVLGLVRYLDLATSPHHTRVEA